MAFFKLIIGAAFALALTVAGSLTATAATAVTHPSKMSTSKAAEVYGTIVVAQRRGGGNRGAGNRGGGNRGPGIRGGGNQNFGNRSGRRSGRGAKIGGVIAGALIGAAILGAAANAQNRRDDYDDYEDRPRRVRRRGGSAEDRCADEFRSFRYSDGTYQPYDSDRRRLCPYL